MRLLSDVFLLYHVWQLPYEIVRVLMIKHYAIYIESGICSPLLAVGSQIWGGFWLDRLLSDITLACPSLIPILVIIYINVAPFVSQNVILHSCIQLRKFYISIDQGQGHHLP